MNKQINLRTAKIIIGYLALIYALAFLFSSCSIAAREGTTSPCYSSKHFVGFGPGGYGKGRMK